MQRVSGHESVKRRLGQLRREREVRNREWEVAAAGHAAGRAAAAADRDMELAELDSRIVAALNRARAVCCEWEIISGVK